LQRIVIDPAKAGEELGWAPTTELQEGLKQTVAWFRATA
jgi:nucleoside-diphosphate-sugar epimerase